MRNTITKILLISAACLLLAAAVPRQSRAQMRGIQITGEVPSSAAAQIAGAGFDSVVIYYSPYRAPAAPKIIDHIKEWGKTAAQKKLRLYALIDTGPPLDAIADPAAIKFRRAASDDGYSQEHKPAPASEDFWKTAIFPKLDALADLSLKLPLKGVFLNLDNHVPVSYDPDTFAEFLKTKDATIDASSYGAQKRKEFLSSKSWLADYEKFQEDRIYTFTLDYFKSLKSRAPGFEIRLASFKDEPLFRAFMRALADVQPGDQTILYTMNSASDKEGHPISAVWTPRLSVREFPPDELSAMLGALDLWKSGFLVSNADSLWLNLNSVDINDWPLGLTTDYLSSIARSKKAGAKQIAAYKKLVNRISERVIGTSSGAPRVALIYSGYRGYMYRDVFDAPLASAGIKIDKYENTKLEKIVPNLGRYDAIFCAPGYNAVKPEKLLPYAKDLVGFVKKGGLLFILDGSMPAQIEWMGKADTALKISVERKDGLTPKWLNSEFKMLGYPMKINKLNVGKNHFVNPDPGWRPLARDNEDMPYAVQRLFGNGMIVALADFDINEYFLVDTWEYMLKIKDRFNVSPDSNAKPIGIGRNDVRFIATTFGPERKLKVQARILTPSRKQQTSEFSLTLSNEGGKRFTVPLDAREAGLYRMTLTFLNEKSGMIDRRDIFSFLAPTPYEALPEKSYYTSEPKAAVRVACRKVKGCGAFSAELTLHDAKANPAAKVLRKKAEGGQIMFELPIGNLAPGDYTLTATITDKSGKKSKSSAPFKKLPPGPAVETKLLNFRGGLLEVNGKPFFPLGIYSIPPENMQEIADAGANAMIFYGNTTQAESDINTALKDKGILFSAYPFYPHSRILDEDKAKLAEELRAKAANDKLFMWYLADEPEGFGQSPELIYEAYKFVKDIDPYHPESIVMMSPESYSRYVRAADVFMFDRYPTPRAPQDTVSEHARASVRAVYGRKPVFAIPQAFDWAVWESTFKDGDEPRPTYTEMRSSAIMSIAADVRGIIYWAFTASRYDMRKLPAHEDDFKRVLKELSGLLDVLAEPNTFVDITVNPDFKGIGWGAKIHAGKLYIFAFNGDPGVRDSVTFTLPKEYTGRSVEVYGENRSINLKGRAFTDAFDYYGSHIYIVPMK